MKEKHNFKMNSEFIYLKSEAFSVVPFLRIHHNSDGYQPNGVLS